MQMTGFRISFSEAGGTQLGNMFSTDLASGQHCGRMENKCKPCNLQESKLQKCKARSIVYESSCDLCNPTTHEKSNNTTTTQEEANTTNTVGEKVMADPSHLGRVGIYIGESSRSLAERCAEHFHDAETFSKKSHMVKHWMSSHEEEEALPTFSFKIIKQYGDCLSRQVGEAIHILLRTRRKLMLRERKMTYRILKLERG